MPITGRRPGSFLTLLVRLCGRGAMVVQPGMSAVCRRFAQRVEIAALQATAAAAVAQVVDEPQVLPCLREERKHHQEEPSRQRSSTAPSANITAGQHRRRRHGLRSKIGETAGARCLLRGEAYGAERAQVAGMIVVPLARH
jgi:hypothetical protein